MRFNQRWQAASVLLIGSRMSSFFGFAESILFWCVPHTEVNIHRASEMNKMIKASRFPMKEKLVDIEISGA